MLEPTPSDAPLQLVSLREGSTPFLVVTADATLCDRADKRPYVARLVGHHPEYRFARRFLGSVMEEGDGAVRRYIIHVRSRDYGSHEPLEIRYTLPTFDRPVTRYWCVDKVATPWILRALNLAYVEEYIEALEQGLTHGQLTPAPAPGQPPLPRSRRIILPD